TPGQVIIDVPLPELLLSEPRVAKTEVPILDDGSSKPFPASARSAGPSKFARSSIGSSWSRRLRSPRPRSERRLHRCCPVDRKTTHGNGVCQRGGRSSDNF